MANEVEPVGTILKVSRSMLKKLKDYQVILGFAGFGNVGFLSMSHIIETAELQSFALWGSNSWYYRENLESTLTAYMHEESKTIFITTRLPIFVSAMSKQFWDKVVEDILIWNAKRYIVIGGLREDTRTSSTEWAAFVPTPKWTEMYGHNRTFSEKLSMIGPLSALLMLGTTMEKPVLGLLAYCNLEEDPDAALFTLSQIEKIADINIPSKDRLHVFDFSFLSSNTLQNDQATEIDTGEYDDFDVDDLL